jgi:hypothetical protein
MKFTRHVALPMAALSGLIGFSAWANGSSAPAASVAKPIRSPSLERLASQSIPKDSSSRPTLEEWKTATPIEVTRRSISGRDCDVLRVREWLKVKCHTVVAAIKQHGGSPENVFFWIGAHDTVNWAEINGGEIIFPMRPGDQRTFEFFRLFPETCFGRQALPWLVVDEVWIEGETTPTVVIR